MRFFILLPENRALKLILLFALIALLAAAQKPPADKSKRPSPPGTAELRLKGKKITVDYSRPSMRGRKIMGELVPYGKVWRTGANEATTLTTEADLTIAGAKVRAGKYTLYTLPSEDTWKLIINKQNGQFGTIYDEKQDLVRVDMAKSSLSQPVEMFAISLKKKSEDSADMVLEWETTAVSVPIQAK